MVNLTWGGSATLTSDYTLTAVGGTLAADGSTLTLASGVTSATITAKPVDDSLVEGAETVTLTLAAGTDYVVGTPGAATGTIADNEFSVSIGNASGTEQDHNKTTLINVPVTLSSASTGTITVTATTVSGSAVAGSDFTAKTQVLTFTPGTTTVNFTVSILPDSIAEPTETFTVVLSAPVGATIATGTGTVTVFDNDGAQMASAAPARSAPAVDRPLSQAALDQAVAQAKSEWSAALPGVDLSGITVTIADLPNLYLGFTMGKTTTIDATAAGWGWSVMYPAGPGPRMDLLTVVRHEVGRAIGLTEADVDRFGVMELTLAPGERRALGPASEARAVALSPARASVSGATPRSSVPWLGGPSLAMALTLVRSDAGHAGPSPIVGDLLTEPARRGPGSDTGRPGTRRIGRQPRRGRSFARAPGLRLYCSWRCPSWWSCSAASGGSQAGGQPGRGPDGHPWRGNGPPGGRPVGFVLGGVHVFGARTLGTLGDIELDALAALQAVEVEGCIEPAAMEEVFLPILGGDEAEAAIGDDLLDCTGGHERPPNSPNWGLQIARPVREGG